MRKTTLYPGPPLALMVKAVIVLLFLNVIIDGLILSELVYREVRHQMTERAVHEILNLGGDT